nr:putative ribonuclease H-like domain-containing protein [Tanacetum cinerariifolium]
PLAPITAEQRLARKNELKARGTLLIALPDKHQLKFNIHKDAKTLMEAIEKRFGGNKETKKLQKTLLKQQYENFTGLSSESLDQIHDRLQKLISQLEILGESLSEEDINLKFLRSLPLEWRTHTLIWRNKKDLEDQSLDDLFTSLKIYKVEVKSSSFASTSTQNIAFASSQNTDSSNESVSAVASAKSNSPQLDNDDLKQIDVDDLEEIDLKWQMTMLTMRARRFLQKTGMNLVANGTISIGFDMSKVECYNCHRRGHFARESRSPKDTRRNFPIEPQRRNVPVETSTLNALVSQCDGVGSYNWSFQAEEEPTNYALMAFTSLSSSSSNNEVASCSKASTKAYATLHFETDESLPASPIYDRYQSREGYHAVPPPHTGTFMPSKSDLVFHEAPNVYKTVHIAFNVKLSPTKPNQDLPHSHRPSGPTIEDWVSDSEDEYEAEPSQNDPNSPKCKGLGNSMNRKACFVCKSLTYLIKDCDYYEKKMVQTLAMNHAQRGNHQHYARMTHPNPQRHVVPTAVLTRSKLVSLTAVRPVTTVVSPNNVIRPRPAKIVGTKPHSSPRRTINRRPSPPASNFPPKVTNVMAPKVNAVKGVQRNWEIQVSYDLGPKETLTFLFLVQGNPHHALKEKGVINNRYSRHITGNMSYLTDFEEINGRYVAFGGNFKGGKIIGKGKIRTGNLDFDDVYFVKKIKFNLFSVSQMCDKKNSVLFTDTECIVLSPEFKLPDENQVLLKVPRENNMFNVDLKNIVPSKDWTCLFAKATLDESNLWHRRLGHINFKTMNKLVKGNLVRGLPSKVFENNHTCVACKKGKQHRASCKTKHVNLMGRLMRIFLVGYSVSSKAFRVFNSRTRIIQETLHINFLENKPNVARSGPIWLFDIDTLSKSMNYQPVTAGNQSNPSAGIQEQLDAKKPVKENVQQYVLFPLWSSGSKDPQNTDGDATFEVKEPKFKVEKPESEVHVSQSSSAKTKKYDDKTKREAKGKIPVELSTGYRNLSEEFEDFSDKSINEVNAASTPAPAVGQISTNSTNTFSAVGPSNTTVSPTHGKYSYVDPSQYLDDPNMPSLEDITYSDDDEDVSAEADFTNLETTITVGPVPTTRVHKDHHVTKIIGDFSSATQTRSMTRMVKDQVDLPNGKRAIGTKWVFRNKRDERGIVFRNKARLVAQGHTQEEGIDYEEVFAPVAMIEAIRLFLAYASFMGFMVYQMDVKSSFVYGTIKEEVYVCQPPGFEDPDYHDKVYKMVKAIYGLHQAPRAWYETLANYLLENGFQRGKIDQTLFIKKKKGDILLVQVYVDDIIFGSTNKDLCKAFEKLMKDKFQMSSMGEHTFFLGLQVKQKQDGIFISQDKYVAEILRKFSLNDGKSASTLIDTEKPLLKDPDGEDVDVHTYRLISCQCKKQTIVATSSTEVEYVAVASCYAQQAADAVDDVVADSVSPDDVVVDVPAADAEPTPPSPLPTTTPQPQPP